MRKTALACALLLAATLLAAKKKKEDETQVLALPQDPPQAVVAETQNLVFHVSPLSAKGLLSQQTRDAVKALLKMTNGASIVKIRAFVAGSGDMRRVPAIVSETMTEKKLALPAVSVIQAGGLPLEGAQVVLEAISAAKRPVNPSGVLFVAGQIASSDKPLEPTLPLAEKSLASLDRVMTGEPLRVTCFTSSIDDAPKIYRMLAGRYPQAAIDVVEMQRATPRSVVDCEATARLAHAPRAPMELMADSQAVAVPASRVALTGTQMAFGFGERDARLAFQRLEKALEPMGTSTKNVAMAHFYPLSNSIGEQVKKIRLEFFDPAHLPAMTLLPFEGLPSMDASFAVDVVAVIGQ